MDDEINKLNYLVEEKQKELGDLAALRIKKLENALSETKKCLSTQQEEFILLKNDFVYNLSLFKERDKEIDSLENELNRVKQQLCAKVGEISQLKIEIDNWKEKLTNEKKKLEESKHFFRKNSLEYEDKIKLLQSKLSHAINEQGDQLSTIKEELDKKLRNADLVISMERQQLQVDFDDLTQKREREHKTRIKEILSTVYNHEMKAKIAQQEFDFSKENERKLKVKCNSLETNTSELEKKMNSLEWEMNNCATAKNLEVAELQSTLKSLMEDKDEINNKCIASKQKYSKLAMEKENEISGIKSQHQRNIAEIQKKIFRLESENKTMKKKLLEMSQMFEKQHKITSKELTRFQHENSKLLVNQTTVTDDHCREITSLNLQLETMSSLQNHLKDELRIKKEELSRCQKNVSQGLERQQIIESSKGQLDLDWRKQFEKLDQEQKIKIDSLSKENASLRDKLTNTKDLNKLQSQKMIDIQNDQLIAVVSQMTLDMEVLSKSKLQNGADVKYCSVMSQSDANNLMNENETLKGKNSDLQNRIQRMHYFNDTVMNDMGETFKHGNEEYSAVITRKQLKVSALKIAQLMQEREHLVQMGNKLRSQLKSKTETKRVDQMTQTEIPATKDTASHYISNEDNVNIIPETTCSLSTPSSIGDVWKLLDDTDGLISSVNQSMSSTRA